MQRDQLKERVFFMSLMIHAAESMQYSSVAPRPSSDMRINRTIVIAFTGVCAVDAFNVSPG